MPKKKSGDIVDLLMVTRQALLTIVDAIEVFADVRYRTATLRRDYKTLREKHKSDKKRIDEWHGEDGHV